MSLKLRNTGAYASIISGILLILAHTLNLNGSTNFGTVLGGTLVLVAHLLLVFAFIGLYEAQNKENDLLGWLGMVAGVLGTILVSAIVNVEIAGASGVEVEAVFASVVPNSIHSIGPLLFVIGMIFLGISIIRGKTLPSVAGVCLIIGTLIFLAGSFIDIDQATVSVIGAIFTGAGLIWLGLYVIIKSPQNNQQLNVDNNSKYV